MVAPGFLKNHDVVHWLNGVEPAWTMLEFESYCALREEPSASNQVIRIEYKLTSEEISGSAVARNAHLLLRKAIERDGLKLTASGNLSRAVVEEMRGIIEWPYDAKRFSQINKVINEPDFLPLHFVGVLCQASKLLRAHRGQLIPARVGKAIVTEDHWGALQAILFHIAFWHLNLGYFDRMSLESWPQNDIGIVLWSLSIAANDWRDPEILTRLCTVPVIGVLQSAWDLGSFAMEGRILRPLIWFGLLEKRTEPMTGLV
jgi:hypothetical protein